MNGKYRRAMVKSLQIESDIPPPPLKAVREKVEYPESPWKEFVMQLQDGNSVVIPTRQIASLATYARRAGFKRVQSSRLGNMPWTAGDLDSIHPKGTIVHQSRVWFFTNE